MRCVTSFGPEGYALYGKRFLETYVEHVGLPIDVFIEGDPKASRPEFDDRLVTYRDLFKVPGCAEFLNTTLNFPCMQGHAWGEDKRNYRFDVHRFCRKSFAQIAAASYHPEWMYWIDADVEFTAPTILPRRDAFMLYLGRPEWHSCASFIGWNLTHDMAGEFFKRYWTLYMTGTVFALPEWHDSFLVDWLREQTEVPAVNLAAGMDLKGPANVFDEVFKTAHHKKGNLKHVDQSGVSEPQPDAA